MHFDVDVVDFVDAPLSENTARNVGLPLDTALRALRSLAASERLLAPTVTELDPHHASADATALPRLVDGLARALAAWAFRAQLRVLSSTPASTQGCCPRFCQSCGVPRWITESPGWSVISRSSKISVISPESTTT